jgi:hypothetical protein
MSQAVAQLHSWLGITHLVSLVDRHESNGVERRNQDVLRHLTALVFDERFKDRWSDDTILSLIEFSINDSLNSETGVRAFDAKFGTHSGTYFRLPPDLPSSLRSSSFLSMLDADLRSIHSHIRKTNNAVVAKRLNGATPERQNQYQPGDFVLHLQDSVDKLSPKWYGPWRVLSQVTNSVLCRHLATGETKKLHVDRLKIFHGSESVAFDAAMRDQDQYLLASILAYRGDPFQRTSLLFLLLYADGDQRWRPFDKDLTETSAFATFCSARRQLHVLLEPTAKLGLAFRARLQRMPIDRLQVIVGTGDSRADFVAVMLEPSLQIYIDLRLWSDTSLNWYYSLDLPNPDTHTYLVPAVYGRFKHDSHLSITVHCAIFDSVWEADPYWCYAYGSTTVLPIDHVTLVDATLISSYPAILPRSSRSRSSHA